MRLGFWIISSLIILGGCAPSASSNGGNTSADGSVAPRPDSGDVTPDGGMAWTFPKVWVQEPGYRVSPIPLPGTNMTSNPLAAELITLDNGRYRVFFSVPQQGVGSAISTDGFNFTLVEGMRITSQREDGQWGFDVGHPYIIRLRDGRWRMLHGSSNGIDADSRIESALSPDGWDWSNREGEKMQELASSFWFIGHGRLWRGADGAVMALVSANTNDDQGPSDVALLRGTDEGLTFESLEPHLWQDHHDPTVVRGPDGRIYAVSQHLLDGFWVSSSADDRRWSPLERIELRGNSGTPIDPSKVEDVALLKLADGSLRMFGNDPENGIRSFIPAAP